MVPTPTFACQPRRHELIPAPTALLVFRTPKRASVNTSVPAVCWIVQNCSFRQLVLTRCTSKSECPVKRNTASLLFHQSTDYEPVDIELNWTAWRAPVLPHSRHDN